MKSIFEEIETLDKIIREMHKIDSKMVAGQFIGAYRELRRVTAFFEQHKAYIIKNNIALNKQNGANGTTDTTDSKDIPTNNYFNDSGEDSNA